jgi:hypothetical protein
MFVRAATGVDVTVVLSTFVREIAGPLAIPTKVFLVFRSSSIRQ